MEYRYSLLHWMGTAQRQPGLKNMCRHQVDTPSAVHIPKPNRSLHPVTMELDPRK